MSSAKDGSKEDVQKKYLELQMIKEQLEQLQKQAIVITQRVEELSQLQESVQSIQTMKRGADLFVQLGGGIHVKASLQDVEKVLVNVGADTIVPRTVVEAVEMIGKQIQELKDVESMVSSQLQKLAEQGQSLHQELKKILA